MFERDTDVVIKSQLIQVHYMYLYLTLDLLCISLLQVRATGM